MSFKRRSLPAPSDAPQASNADTSPERQSASPVAPHDGIPPHVWETLQQAGEEAAQRLLSLLQSPRFNTFAPTAQKALIELAMTRAYGLPVRRSVEVKLSSDDADAVAASLSALRDSLPERGPVPRDITPDDSSGGEGADST